MTREVRIPSHWDIGNIRRFAQMKSGHTPSRSVSAYWKNADIPWFTLADVWQLRDGKQIYLADTANMINEIGLANSSAELLPAGTVVLSRTASVGFSGIMPRPMATSQDFWNWVCGPELLPEYLNYQFKSMTAEFKSLNMGSTHQTIYQKDAATLRIAVPPLAEQHAIADFLDRETARTDALIKEQNRLVEILQLRRRAVVDAALSRGLNSNTVLSETGSPWIPQLPRAWKAVRTKRVLSFGPANGVSPEAGDSDGLKSLSLGAIRDGRVSMAPEVTKLVNRSSVADAETLRLHPGDILLVRGNGNVDLVARAGLVGPEFAAEDYIYPDLLIRVRVNSSMLSEFFVWACNASATRAQVQAQARTAVGTFKVAGGDVRSLVLPLPPVHEQRAIVAYLDEKTSKIDLLIAESEQFIELSKERRSALITAVVTGQIDVRAMA